MNHTIMKTFSSLFLLGAVGALSAAASSAIAAVDTSLWKCETCPFEKAGAGGNVDAGVGAVSDEASKFGDYTGLHKNGAFAVLGGTARYRGDGGLFGSATANDLGLDSRSLAAELGQEGLYTLRMSYAEIPRWFTMGAKTPFLGNGSGQLTLAPGFVRAGNTAGMSLAADLQAIELGFKRTRLDLGAALNTGEGWTHRIDVRRDERSGTRRGAGAFFASSSHLALPVDHVTDELEVSTSYSTRQWQAMLAYRASLFSNGETALTWANPFDPSATSSGRLALAPDNQFHQIIASGGYQISPMARASAEVALGRMTQDEAYLAATTNGALTVPALPAQSLQGRANTLNASLRLSAALTEQLRINASLTRDERDNRTPSLAYPSVTTDQFVGLGAARSNQPYSFTQDRVKLSADHRGFGSWKFGVGADYDSRERTLQAVDTTRESTLWGRIGVQALDNIALALRLAHADRKASDYRAVASLPNPENPLMRKFNIADRQRDSAGLRADFTVTENVSLGLSAEMSYDDYRRSTIGLLDARTIQAGADLSAALSEQTQAHAFAQVERVRSRQAGSQAFAGPDWKGRSKDAADVAGLGLKHSAMKGRLELGADLVFSRARSEVNVDAGVSAAPFPNATTSSDSVKLHATYRIDDNLSLLGSYWYEQVEARDWRFDGVQADTISNLLAFGEQAPRYSVNVLRVALRYRF